MRRDREYAPILMGLRKRNHRDTCVMMIRELHYTSSYIEDELLYVLRAS